MSLASEYKRQFTWRDWSRCLGLSPIKPGQRVLDLGCGPGDISRELANRGAIVTGVDANEDLLTVARRECPTGCTFVKQDLAVLDLSGFPKFDGLWCSFTAAYFSDFEKTFQRWMTYLAPNAWICLVEIDDLLGHQPLSNSTQQRILAFYDEAFRAGRYDFLAGRKLNGALERAGFSVGLYTLKDLELSFDGPASAEVIQAWEERFSRMSGLKTFFGNDFLEFREEFLRCIASKSHQSTCKVVCCIGTRP